MAGRASAAPDRRAGEISDLLRLELSAVKIPPRPAVMARIEREMRNPTPDFATLEAVVGLDVGISASLVKIANSPFCGVNGRVRSVKDAMHILGLNAVAMAIAALSLRKAFAHVLHLERYWDASGRTAQLSGWLVDRLGIDRRALRPEEAYTFGLFRDCGIPVLMSMYADYCDILKIANDEAVLPFTTVEDAEMGLNHATVGAALAQEWLLPAEFRVAIERHHQPETLRGDATADASDIVRRFVAIAQLAEYLFQQLTGLNKTREWSKLGADCCAVLGLTDAAEIDRLRDAAQAEGVHLHPAI